jgi:hypothetical protein
LVVQVSGLDEYGDLREISREFQSGLLVASNKEQNKHKIAENVIIYSEQYKSIYLSVNGR